MSSFSPHLESLSESISPLPSHHYHSTIIPLSYLSMSPFTLMHPPHALTPSCPTPSCPSPSYHQNLRVINQLSWHELLIWCSQHHRPIMILTMSLIVAFIASLHPFSLDIELGSFHLYSAIKCSQHSIAVCTCHFISIALLNALSILFHMSYMCSRLLFL